MVLGEEDFHMQKNEVRSYLTQIQKLTQKMDQRPICKNENHIQLLEENRYKSSWLWIRQWFLGYDTKSTSNQRKKLTGFYQNLQIIYLIKN